MVLKLFIQSSVVYNKHDSELKVIRCGGVAKESILGPFALSLMH